MIASLFTLILLLLLTLFLGINTDFTNKLFGCNLLKNEVRKAMLGALIVLLIFAVPISIVKNCFGNIIAPTKNTKKN
jgi:hypothetical protein